MEGFFQQPISAFHRGDMASLMYIALKILLTSIFIVIISEIGKKHHLLAALLASIPIVSVWSMIWIYVDTHDNVKVSEFATSIFWLVIPSLIFFVILPLLLRSGMDFYLSMSLGIAATMAGYALIIWLYLARG